MRTVRVGCGAGFWGDDVLAPGRLVRDGHLDYLAIDYLAEITMGILRKHLDRNPETGYALDVVTVMKDLLPLLAERPTKIVTNAGGLNPVACGRAIAALIKESQVPDLRVAVILGDDLMPDLDGLASRVPLTNLEDGRAFDDIRDRVVTANAYLGAEPIVRALESGADIVICGRSTDAALILGPLMFEFGWKPGDWDRLAAGVIAGHIVECTGQVTGGNHQADWQSVPGLEQVGYPIVDVGEDGSIVVTKPADTGGIVTRETVTEQLLHEIFADPLAIPHPDVSVDWTSFTLGDDGPNRVLITGVRGSPAPESLKATISYRDGYKTALMWPYAAPQAAAKARAALAKIQQRVEVLGLHPDATHSDIFGLGAIHGPRAELDASFEPAEVIARFAARGTQSDMRRLAREQAPMTYGPPGLAGHLVTGVGHVSEIISHWPALVPRDSVSPQVVHISQTQSDQGSDSSS